MSLVAALSGLFTLLEFGVSVGRLIAVGVVAFLLGILGNLALRTPRLATVYRTERPTTPSFFKRKRDDIIISASSTLVGFGLGVVATLLLQD